MKAYIEYLTTEGACTELNFATLETRITEVSKEREPEPGELLVPGYVDITLDRCGWDLLPKRQQPKNRIKESKFSIPSDQLTALANGLGARRPEDLRGMKVKALYQTEIKRNRYPLLIGFVRPEDIVELER
jgi:hypothetical protein